MVNNTTQRRIHATTLQICPYRPQETIIATHTTKSRTVHVHHLVHSLLTHAQQTITTHTAPTDIDPCPPPPLVHTHTHIITIQVSSSWFPSHIKCLWLRGRKFWKEKCTKKSSSPLVKLHICKCQLNTIIINYWYMMFIIHQFVNPIVNLFTFFL